MLARTAKYSAWRSRGRTCVEDFLSTDTQLVADVLLYNGGCWQSSPTAPKSYQLPHQQLHARNARCCASFSLYQVANLRPRLPAQHVHRGYDPSWWWTCVPSLISDDIGEAFKVTTDDIVCLLVKIPVGRVHHVGEKSNHSGPTTLFAKRFRNRTRESHHIVTVSCSISKIRSMSKSASSRIKATIFLRDFPQLSPCLVSQDFHLAKHGIYFFFTPNVRHFWASNGWSLFCSF